MSGARTELSVSPSELERISRVQALSIEGLAGSTGLLGMRTDPSWAVRREVIAALGALGDAAAPALVDSLVRERGDETRIAATVDALVASTADVYRLLAPLIDGAASPVLADIAQILGRRRNGTSVPALAVLAQHRDDNVAVAAIESLGRIGGRAVVDVLVQAVQSARFFRTFAAIDVLGRSGDPRAVPVLAPLVDNIHYGFEAARALGRTHDRAAVAPLAGLMSSTLDANVRVAALAFAELHETHRQRFTTAAPVESLLRAAARDTALRRLVQCFDRADPAEQAAICTVLGALRSERAMPSLMRALDGPPAVVEAAAAALKALGDGSDEQLLHALREGDSARRLALLPLIMGSHGATEILPCLADPEPEVRRSACEALGRIGNPAATPALFAVLSDANPGVVQAAIAAIQSLGSGDAAELASAASQSPSAGVRRAALRILSYLGHVPALGIFMAAARDSDVRVRDVAIGGLALLDSMPALDALLELSSAESPPTRASAMRALGHSGGERRVLERLGAALADEDAWVRYYACQSLGRLKAESFVSAIAALVDDPAGQVRVAAIEALSHLRHDLAFGALKLAAQSPEPDVQRVALLGLGLSRRNDSVPMLVALASSADAPTRLVALSALVNFDAAEALSATVAALDDTDDNVSAAAVNFLSARKGAKATELLAESLKVPRLRARAQVALSLPGEHRVAGLLSALRTADDEVAALITTLLVRLHRPEATAALFEALTLPNSAARRAAATTLGALGSREAYAALQRLALEDPDPELRRVCALLLGQ